MISQRVRAAYDLIAPAFAARNAAMPTELLDLGTGFLDLLRASAGAAPWVLDLGCGAGRDMAWMERQGARVAGADLSSGMLSHARRQARGPVVQADMRRLPFARETFDGVWCMASLLHLPKSDAPLALREMRRVLAPGGAIAIGIQEGEGEVWEAGAYGHPVERFFARYGPEEADVLLAEAGFRVRERGLSTAGTRRWLRFLATTSADAPPALSGI
ncbi:MAG: class I SAM-dependent methyltransferase [Chloroflexota bacterium]